jgi:excisionase family DNA binding protein
MNGHTPTPERITTAEAARRLGVSVATVRRRVAAGELPGEREDRPGGARWWVLWSDGAAPTRAHEPARDSARERGDERDALAIALRTIGRLERELEIAHMEKSQLLSALNARALPAPVEPERSHEPSHERTLERPRPPWWQWWRRREKAPDAR